MTAEEPIPAALERASVNTWIALGSALVALDVLLLVAYLTRGAVSS